MYAAQYTKVNLIVILYSMFSSGLTFENFHHDMTYTHSGRALPGFREKFSKFSLLLYLLYAMAIELTFENFHHIHDTHTQPTSTAGKSTDGKNTQFSKIKILKRQPTTPLPYTIAIEWTFEKFDEI